MQAINFDKAFYIKLGRYGKWEDSSISESKLRIGWGQQDLEDINQGRWEVIREQLSRESSDKGAVTRDLNALRLICESTSQDVWITFYASRLWWCRVGSATILEDKISKYRKVRGSWSDCDIHGNILFINRIPGGLSKIQGFRGTACRVKELETLRRLLNDEQSPEYRNIEQSRRTLIQSVRLGIKKLHWKDFETFVDLLYRESGWRRVSMLGETMKYADLELEDPITRDQYQVQIKSRATLADFKSYSKQFRGQGYRKLYFVVHSPDQKLARFQGHSPDIELVLPDRLSEMAVNLGLVDWLMNRIK
ncbi:MAG: hypothetical protein ACFFCW_07005 [Candidatus Hodarchaeota archaeon]